MRKLSETHLHLNWVLFHIVAFLLHTQTTVQKINEHRELVGEQYIFILKSSFNKGKFN